jgi:hypothetical protein
MDHGMMEPLDWIRYGLALVLFPEGVVEPVPKQYPTLPRGNYSTVHDTTGKWGLNWYAEHTTAGSVDVSNL